MGNKENKNTHFRLSNKTKLIPRDISESLGKLPPQALDLEEAVLGAVMLESSSFTAVADVLHPETFYSESHREIWGAIQTLFNNSEPIDMRTVVAQLRKDGKIELVGGAFYIAELTSKVSSAANVEYHARIVCEMAIKREMIQIASQVHQNAYEDDYDVFELLDETQGNFDTVSSRYLRSNIVDVKTLLTKHIKIMEERNSTNGVTGCATGYPELDKICGGFQNKNLIIIAGRPSMGKSVVAVEIGKNVALTFNKAVAVFSLEMGNTEVMDRLIASEAEIELDKIVQGRMADHEWQMFAHKTNRISSSKLFIDDTAALSILELRARCRRLKHEHNIELIVVDYLQLMKGSDSGNRENEIASISRGLKGIAKELNVPVIALSQLSRKVEDRGGDKRPQLADLRESGSIEQDADVVLFCYRPEYYKITVDEEGMPTQGVMEIICAKNRNGKTGAVKLKFIGKYAKLANWDQPEVRDNPFSGMIPMKKLDVAFEIRDTSTTEVDRDQITPPAENKDDLPF